MKRRAIRPVLHVFAIALLVAAVLTGTWQQNHMFRQIAGETVLARVQPAPRAVEARTTGNSSRPCPRLLHLDATLSSPPVASPSIDCTVHFEPEAAGRTLSGLAPSVDTPPPRA